MRSDRASFEVRCPHCDVSFPVETRTCVHCGGKTVPSTGATEFAIGALPVFDFDSTLHDEHEPEHARSMSPQPATSPQPAMSPQPTMSPQSAVKPRPEAKHPSAANSASGRLEEVDDDSEAPSMGRSILGSMGSLIWIAMLIAFSLSGKVCGE